MPDASPSTLPKLSRARLRNLLGSLLRTSEDLDAFCGDHFGKVYERFTSGLNRLQRDNLLLDLASPEAILVALQQFVADDGEKRSKLETILREVTRHPTDPARDSATEELEALYDQREVLRRSLQDVGQVNQRIAELKRYLRQGPQLNAGEVLSERYRLDGLIGSGGFATVWLASDRSDKRSVAVKVLHGEQSRDPSRVERFYRGAIRLRQLNSPHIVRILDGPDEFEGYHYYVMEYLPGGDLGQAILQRKLLRPQGLRAVLEVGQALHLAHKEGLIHRDVKPGNILLDLQGTARLADFDLVWANDTTGGTRTGAMGTYIYAAPEALEDGSRVDARADVFSLGMTALFVLYASQAKKNLPLHLVENRLLFVLKLDCDSIVKEVLARALSRNPDDRYPTVAKFCADLAEALEPTNLKPLAPAVVSPPRPSQDSLQPPPIAPPKRPSHRRRWVSYLGMATGLCLAGSLYWIFFTPGRVPSVVMLPQPAPNPTAAAPIAPAPLAMADAGADLSLPAPPAMMDASVARIDQIHDVKLRAIPAINRCYPEGLRAPEKIIAEFSVQAGGRVSDVSLNIAGDGADCVRGIIRNLLLPKPEGVSYSVRWDFRWSR